MLNRKDSKTPLYIQMKNELLKRIASGQFPEDSKLPTERDLMKEYGVGRATVRVALAELERGGYILKRHGIGSFVSSNAGETGLEAIVSLSFFLERLGVYADNEVIFDRKTTAKGELLKAWEQGQEIYHLRRLRRADGFPVAMEDSYFLPEYYELIIDKEKSIASALLHKSGGLKMEKIELVIVAREANEEEKGKLSLTDGASVLELTRWIYDKKTKKAVSFVRFIMAEKIIEYPFSAIL